jgi:hypothetical protein
MAVGILRYKALDMPFKLLTWSVAAEFIIAMLNHVFVKQKNNAPLLHLEAISQFVLYSLAYYYLFNNKTLKKATIAVLIMVVVFFVINAVWLQPFRHIFPTNVNMVSLALLAVFSLLLFNQMLLYPLSTPLLKQGVFWFNTAIIFYSTTMFFDTGLSNVYKDHSGFNYFSLYFWYTIVVIFTVLMGIALLTDSKKNNKPYAL